MSPTSVYQIRTKHESFVALLEDLLYKSRTNDSLASHTTQDAGKHGYQQKTTTATILLICMTREDFLAQLASEIHHPHSHATTDDDNARAGATVSISSSDPIITTVDTNLPSHRHHHRLLIPTLHTLSMSRSITTVFIPTLASLRAYIATIDFHAVAHSRLKLSESALSPESLPDSTSALSIEVIVVNLIGTHLDTSEFSLQGISRTCAGLVTAIERVNGATKAKGNGIGCRVAMVECRVHRGDTGVEDADEGSEDDEEVAEGGINAADGGTKAEERSQGRKIWDAQVPLLSGSVRIGTGIGAWSGRTVSVKKVVERWFDFVDS